MKQRFSVLSVMLLLGFWLVSLRSLAVVPPVYEDEPWQASTGWKLAREGVFGSDLFAGYHGMERHYYGFMPGFPFLLAAVFTGAGTGLFQARFVTVSLGALTLALTTSLGRRLFRPAVGVLGGFLLLIVPLTARTPSQYTGIVLVDVARIARYDAAVPVFGLLALHVYWAAGRRPQRGWLYAVAGLLAGLSALSHLYGAFWLVALIALAAWQRAGRRRVVALLLGFSLPWLPYVAYVLSGLPDWVGQTRGYGPRFELLDPGWYLRNLLTEPRRYAPGLGPPGRGWLQRPGFWAAAVAVPLSALALGRRTIRGDQAAATLLLPLIMLPLLMAGLISLKLSNYLFTIVPLFALAAAWGAAALWGRATGPAQLLWRGMLLLIFLVVALEGVTRLREMDRAAAETTPYRDFAAQLRRELPAGAAILGLHHYWFGLEGFTYRSWAVPLLLSAEAGGRSVDHYLSQYRPNAILVDSRMRDYFAANPVVEGEVRGWIAARGYRLAIVDDPTYGRFEIYRREP